MSYEHNITIFCDLGVSKDCENSIILARKKIGEARELASSEWGWYRGHLNSEMSDVCPKCKERLGVGKKWIPEAQK